VVFSTGMIRIVELRVDDISLLVGSVAAYCLEAVVLRNATRRFDRVRVLEFSHSLVSFVISQHSTCTLQYEGLDASNYLCHLGFPSFHARECLFGAVAETS
jgi:hypothetical protein